MALAKKSGNGQLLASGARICVRVTSFFESNSNVTIFLQQPTELPAERDTRSEQDCSGVFHHVLQSVDVEHSSAIL